MIQDEIFSFWQLRVEFEEVKLVLLDVWIHYISLTSLVFKGTLY